MGFQQGLSGLNTSSKSLEVIGNNVARAFSLVGALSIVRFRTVVDDTRDTAFVMFAVIIGMAVGAGQYLVPAAGIPTIALAALAMNQLGQGRRLLIDGTLTVRLGLGRRSRQARLRPLRGGPLRAVIVV